MIGSRLRSRMFYTHITPVIVLHTRQLSSEGYPATALPICWHEHPCQTCQTPGSPAAGCLLRTHSKAWPIAHPSLRLHIMGVACRVGSVSQHSSSHNCNIASQCVEVALSPTRLIPSRSLFLPAYHSVSVPGTVNSFVTTYRVTPTVGMSLPIGAEVCGRDVCSWRDVRHPGLR